jgi:HEAT repeat protein
LLLGAGSLLLVAAAYLWLVEHPGDRVTASSESPAAKLQWNEGRFQQYDLLIDSSFLMTMPGASSGQSMNLHMKGVLEFQTLEVGPADVVVGMRLASLDMSISGETDPEVNRALTAPFRVRLSLNGRVKENLVRMFQVTIEDVDTWVAKESNASGHYEAAYTRIAPSVIEKNKQRYVHATPPLSATIPKVTSKESIRIDENSDWIAGMTLEENLVIRDSAGPYVDVINHAGLQLRSVQPGTATAANDWRFAATTPTATAAKKRPRQLTSALSREEAKRQLRAGVASLDTATKGRSILIHRLRDFMLVDGELPFVLLEIMRADGLADRTRADIYLAFELAGSPEAQMALASIMLDSSWTPEDGIRAIVALGGVADPTAETMIALWDTANSGLTGGGRDDMPGTAALALGSLGQGLLAAGDPSYPTLRADLLDAAAGASSSQQRAVFLYALGNTHDPDPSLRSDIVPYLDDHSAEVRSAAARTLGQLGSSEVAEVLQQRFMKEQNQLVRGSIAEALLSWEDPSPAAIQSLRSAIRNEPDERVRYNIARILGSSLEQFPENRAVLEQLMAEEPSRRIQQEVAEMLYPR